MGCGCGCGGQCHGDDRLGYLAALSPDEAVEQFFPQAKVGSHAGHNQGVHTTLVNCARSGRMYPRYEPGTSDCPALGPVTGRSNVQLAQMAGGLALTGATIGLTAGGLVTAAALAPWTMGISAIIGLFPVIFGHHAQAVKKEQSVLCAAVPAANNYLDIIEQAVAAGQATPQEGIAALESLESDFGSQVSAIRHGTDPTSRGECNAACVMASCLHAIVIEKTSEYTDLATAVAPASTAGDGNLAPSATRPNVTKITSVPPAASSYASFYGGQPAPAPASGLPSWVGIAAIVALGFLWERF